MSYILIWYFCGLVGILISIKLHRNNEIFVELVKQDWKMILLISILGFFNLIVAALDIVCAIKINKK